MKLTDEQVSDLRSKHGWAKETIRAIEAEVLRLNGVGGEVVNRYLDVTLTKDEAEYIAAFIADENDADDDVVQLLVGAGHSGFGLYAWHPEYQEEGSVLVKVLPEPEPLKAADAFELHRLLAEERETVRQLNRALREAIEPPTFMGEPAAPQPQQAAPGAVAVLEGWMQDEKQVRGLLEHLTNCGWRQTDSGPECYDQGAAMAAEVIEKVLLPMLTAAPGAAPKPQGE